MTRYLWIAAFSSYFAAAVILCAPHDGSNAVFRGKSLGDLVDSAMIRGYPFAPRDPSLWCFVAGGEACPRRLGNEVPLLRYIGGWDCPPGMTVRELVGHAVHYPVCERGA